MAMKIWKLSHEDGGKSKHVGVVNNEILGFKVPVLYFGDFMVALTISNTGIQSKMWQY